MMTGKRNRLGILTFSALFLTGVLLIAGCVGPKEPTGTSTTKHFGLKGISVDYPATWVIQTASSRYAITTFTDPNAERTNVFFEKRTMPAGYTLKRINDELVLEMTPTEIISGTSVTVAGLPAFETVLKTQQGLPVRDYQAIFVCLEKDGWVYTIYGSAPVEFFDEAQPSFEMIISSFQIP